MAAEDISTLILQVKSDGIKEGTAQLNELTQASVRAEGVVKKLGTGVVQTETATKRAAGSVKAMAEAEDAATRAVGAATTAYKQKAITQQRQIEILNTMVRAQDQANRMNAAWDKAASRSAQSAEAQERAMAKIQIQANAMNAAFDKQVEAQKKLASATDGATEASKKSAHGHGSNAAAIREVMVLTHELSQGSYKRFGGSMLVLANQLDVIPKLMNFIKTSTLGTIGAWAIAGTGIVALVGGLGLLAFGLMQGARDWKHFNDALLQTGNYAGATVDGLRNIAAEVAHVGGTIGTAKEAVALLAASGKFTKDQIGGIAEAATLMEEAFGVSVEKTVEEFGKLAELAVTSTARSTNAISQHTMKLNDHYHFLTAAQFEEISALEKEGKALEAAKLATELFASSQKTRAEESIKNLGYVAQAWHGIKSAVSGALDAIGQWGAKPTLQRQIIEMEQAKHAQEKLMNTEAARLASNAGFDKAIADLKKKAAADEAAAAAKGQAAQLEQDRMHAGARLRVLVEANDKQAKKQRELSELERDWSIQTNDYKLKHQKEYEIAKAKIEADSELKAPKGSDTRATDRDAAIDDLKKSNRERLEAIDGFITLSKERARKEGADRRAELSEREGFYQEERNKLEAALKKEVEIYDKFNAKTPEERAVNARKRQNAKDDTGIKLAGINRLEAKDREDVKAAEIQELEKLEEQSEKHYVAEVKRVEELVKAERIRLSGIAELKSVKMDAQAAEEDADAASLQRQFDLRAGMIDLMRDTGIWSARKADAADRENAALLVEIKGRKELADIHRVEAGKQRGLEAAQRMTKDLDAGVAAAKRFEKSLVQAFGNVGKAIGGMGVAFSQMAKDRDTAQEQFRNASEEDKANGKAKAELERAQTTATLNGYANMAESAKGFFNEKSRGYQLMDGVAKVFHAAELARNLAMTVSGIAAGAAQMFAQSGWGGFAGVAAMGAVMAGLGYAVTTSSNSGGKSAEQMQREQGTGSVFGDVGTKNSDGSISYKDKSESITKSLEILKDNSNILLPVNQAMLASLHNIEASMAGLTNLIVRTPGLVNGDNMGIQTGTLSRTNLNSTLAGVAGGAGLVGGLGMGAISGFATAALGAVTFGVGALAGVVISKLVSLWGSTKQEIKDSGLQFGGRVSDLQAGYGFNQYASVDTTKSSWFGLSKSTSNRVQTQGLSAELSQQFGLIFTNLEDTLKLAAGSLGKSSAQVGAAIDNMVVSTTKVSLKGLSGKELQDAINGVISKTMDEIAQAAFPAMDDFRQVGEGYAQTVLRVATGVEVAKAELEKFGITAVNYTQVLNKQGDVAVEIAKQSIAACEAWSGVNDIIQSMSGSIADLTAMYGALVAIRKQMNGVGLNGGKLDVNVIKGAGGVSELGTALTNYQDKYFTEQEKAGIMLKSVTADFAKLGLTLPASKQALRDLITHTGVSTAATAKLTGELLGLSGAYSDLIDASNEANSKATESLNSTIDSLKQFSEALKEFKGSLVLGDLSTLTPTQKYLEAKRQYEETVTKAMTGDVTAQSNVTGIAQSYLQAAQTVFASSPEYSSAFNAVLADIERMSSYTDSQLTDAEKQLAVLQEQVDGINALNATAVGIQNSLDNLVIAMPPPVMVSAPMAIDTSALEAKVSQLITEVAGGKLETGKLMLDLMAVVYDAQNKGAGTIAEAVTDSVKETAWASATSKTITVER